MHQSMMHASCALHCCGRRCHAEADACTGLKVGACKVVNLCCQVLGSCCFITGALLFMLETQPSWWRIQPFNAGWHVSRQSFDGFRLIN